MRKIILLILFGLVILTSCTEKTPYKLEDIKYLGIFHDDLFLTSRLNHKYSIIISKDEQQRKLIMSTKHRLLNISAGDSIYLLNNDLIKISQ